MPKHGIVRKQNAGSRSQRGRATVKHRARLELLVETVGLLQFHTVQDCSMTDPALAPAHGPGVRLPSENSKLIDDVLIAWRALDLAGKQSALVRCYAGGDRFRCLLRALLLYPPVLCTPGSMFC